MSNQEEDIVATTLSTPARRVPRRRSETRARLLTAGRELMLERGLSDVSIDAITARAGYTRGAFYSNFGSLDDLVFALYSQQVVVMLDALDSVEHGGASEGGVSIEDVVARVLEVLPSDIDWLAVRVSFAARARRDPELSERFVRHERELREALEPALLTVVSDLGRTVVTSGAEFTHAVIAAHDGALANGVTAEDAHGLRIQLCSAVVTTMTAPHPE